MDGSWKLPNAHIADLELGGFPLIAHYVSKLLWTAGLNLALTAYVQFDFPGCIFGVRLTFDNRIPDGNPAFYCIKL